MLLFTGLQRGSFIKPIVRPISSSLHQSQHHSFSILPSKISSLFQEQLFPLFCPLEIPPHITIIKRTHKDHRPTIHPSVALRISTSSIILQVLNPVLHYSLLEGRLSTQIVRNCPELRVLINPAIGRGALSVGVEREERDREVPQNQGVVADVPRVSLLTRILPNR